MSVGIYTDENGYVKAAGAAKEGTATNTTYDNNKSKIQANNVQSAIDEIAEGGLGKEMTKEQYNALPEEKKMDGSQYFIKDEDLFIPQMVDMRKATYDALPESEKKNGNTYFITDEHSEPSAENIDYVGDISANNVKDALDTLNSTMSNISSSKTYNNTVTVTHHNGTKETIIDFDNVSINGASYTHIGNIQYKPRHAVNGIVLSSDRLLYKTYIGTNGDLFIYPINTSSSNQLVFGQLVYFSSN